MDDRIIRLTEALQSKNYLVSCFKTKEEAASYIDAQFEGAFIGFGDSETMIQMGLYDKLAAHNTVRDPNHRTEGETFGQVGREALMTDYFFTSANAVTEDGVIINLDADGNRVAGSLFGHKKTFYIIGSNKITKSIEEGVWRTRNIAAPTNAKRLGLNTPCAIKGDKCYDCSNKERICNGLLIQYRKMDGMETEVIIIEENLGF